MGDALARLKAEKIPFLFNSYSSLDRYFRVREAGPTFLATDSSIVSLAKAFDDLQYPGLPLEDVAVPSDGGRLVFRCVDTLAVPPAAPFTVMGLFYDPERDTFIDRSGIYPDLRAPNLSFVPGEYPAWIGLCEAAKLVSRYHYSADGFESSWSPGAELPPASYQRDLIVSLMLSRSPEKGFRLLAREGFVGEAWPELEDMARVSHAKDYHPEGNVWEHTLETLRYRKRMDLVLSLSLLLHDVGKPGTEGSGEKRFDGHAELGARIAVRFLGRLGFGAQTIDEVSFLVRFHMMPPALKTLPPFRTEPVLASPLFPTLLELYRADLSSSYADEEGYYEACRFYRSFLKQRGNPYRDPRRRSPRAAARHW
jgi:poly(A) polymerase